MLGKDTILDKSFGDLINRLEQKAGNVGIGKNNEINQEAEKVTNEINQEIKADEELKGLLKNSQLNLRFNIDEMIKVYKDVNNDVSKTQQDSKKVLSDMKDVKIREFLSDSIKNFDQALQAEFTDNKIQNDSERNFIQKLDNWRRNNAVQVNFLLPKTEVSESVAHYDEKTKTINLRSSIYGSDKAQFDITGRDFNAKLLAAYSHETLHGFDYALDLTKHFNLQDSNYPSVDNTKKIISTSQKYLFGNFAMSPGYAKDAIEMIITTNAKEVFNNKYACEIIPNFISSFYNLKNDKIKLGIKNSKQDGNEIFLLFEDQTYESNIPSTRSTQALSKNIKKSKTIEDQELKAVCNELVELHAFSSKVQELHGSFSNMMKNYYKGLLAKSEEHGIQHEDITFLIST